MLPSCFHVALLLIFHLGGAQAFMTSGACITRQRHAAPVATSTTSVRLSAAASPLAMAAAGAAAEMKPLRVGILGASGYTGAELVRLLLSHTGVEIAVLTGNTQAGQAFSTVYPQFHYAKDLPPLTRHEEHDWKDVDCVFCCLPHATTQEIISQLPEHLKARKEAVGACMGSYIYERHTPIPKSNIGGFNLDVASFFCGCVVLPLQYLHQMSVAYRDLKPENLLLGQDGYLKLIDFGFAKRIPFKKDNTIQQKSFTLCGTPDYLAPELILSRGHDKAVDYWALGCFLYELLCGRTPFTDPRQAEIFKKAIRSERFLTFPPGFPSAAQDLIRRLLTANATYRLGNLSGGIQDIKSHSMFSGVAFDWRSLYEKRMVPPHKPKVRSAIDTSNFEAVSEEDKVLAYTGPQKLFEGF